MPNTDVNQIENQIVELARQKPIFYADILKELKDADYRSIMRAFGQIRQKHLFGRDDKGRYILAKSEGKSS